MVEEYLKYHADSIAAGDVDPAYAMLRYVCDRFELNVEQRYWLAFLYATCYSGATTFYMYNEFPDFENVDLGRMERWWSANREKVVFQSDRRWIRSRNQFVETVQSYREIVAPVSQATFFKFFCGSSNAFEAYDRAFQYAGQIKNFGRFSLFLYLEAVHVVTGFPMEPRSMDIAEADACRAGLCYALGHDGWARGDSKPSRVDMRYLQSRFDDLVLSLKIQSPKTTVWSVETTLCAYKKFKLGKRWIGYYVERLRKEIAQMESNVRDGVDWSVLNDFMIEKYKEKPLEKEKA